MGLFVRSWPPYDFPLVVLQTAELCFNSTGVMVRVWCFAYNMFHVEKVFGACLEFVWRFEQEHSILFHQGPNSFWHAKRCLNEFGPQCIDIECYSLEPSRQLTWHGTCCKQNNQLSTKTSIELEHNSNTNNLWCMLGGSVWILNEEAPLPVYWGANSF